MAKVSEVITKLQELKDKHGDKEMTIYKSFDKLSTPVDDEQIYFDDDHIYIGIYN